MTEKETLMTTGPDHDHDPNISPLIGDPGRKLTDEEYDATYESGSGGHVLPPEILDELNGLDDPEANPSD
jgi:hypothetical protein